MECFRYLMANRRVTTWSYENSDLEGRCRIGILWVDSLTNKVSWQCGNLSSPWHGIFELIEEPFTHFHVHFDCRGREDQMKVTQMLPGPKGILRGHDSARRNIIMYPLALWVVDYSRKVWEQRAAFSTRTGEWIQFTNSIFADH